MDLYLWLSKNKNILELITYLCNFKLLMLFIYVVLYLSLLAGCFRSVLFTWNPFTIVVCMTDSLVKHCGTNEVYYCKHYFLKETSCRCGFFWRDRHCGVFMVEGLFFMVWQDRHCSRFIGFFYEVWNVYYLSSDQVVGEARKMRETGLQHEFSTRFCQWRCKRANDL